MNPNVLRRWIKESENASGLALNERRPMTIDATPGFVELPMGEFQQQQAAASGGEIRIELQRNGITMLVTWPASRAAESAAWVREVLR